MKKQPKQYYCSLCERKTEPKKIYSVGTYIAILFTWGWWILALPFYKKRCVFCKTTNWHEVKPEATAV